jgi:hypothetical protein
MAAVMKIETTAADATVVPAADVSMDVNMDAVAAPALIPAEPEKKGTKRIRREPVAKEAAAVPVDGAAAAAAAPVPKKKAAAKSKATAPVAADAAAPAPPVGEELSAPPAEPAAEEGRGGALVVHKAVRCLLKAMQTPFHVSADFMSGLNAKMHDVILEATVRAQANGRKTLRASDL